MSVYKFRTIISTNGGTGSENTNNVIHGLCRQIYIKAGTSSTVFRATITDEDSDVVRSYGFSRGEIDDDKPLPVVGIYTIQIASASVDGQFTCKMMVLE